MAMSDWRPNNAAPNDWVYYVCTTIAAFANVHLSRSVDNPAQDHSAINGGNLYYFGVTGTFSPAAQQADPGIRQLLVDAWTDYFTVR
ncbi:hypothetical protein ABT381_13200 [Streptomyces sp. NPDC000151]|uniref:hypothetical protein n=1 Tax=Streptomyces sp. NPDC000151 TaxID=3154244 RepID=UPI003329BE8C